MHDDAQAKRLEELRPWLSKPALHPSEVSLPEPVECDMDPSEVLDEIRADRS